MCRKKHATGSRVDNHLSSQFCKSSARIHFVAWKITRTSKQTHIYTHSHIHMCISVCMYTYNGHPNFKVNELREIWASTSPLSLPSSYGCRKFKTLAQRCVVFLTVVSECEECSLLNKDRSLAMLLQSKHHGIMSPEVL